MFFYLSVSVWDGGVEAGVVVSVGVSPSNARQLVHKVAVAAITASAVRKGLRMCLDAINLSFKLNIYACCRQSCHSHAGVNVFESSFFSRV